MVISLVSVCTKILWGIHPFLCYKTYDKKVDIVPKGMSTPSIAFVLWKMIYKQTFYSIIKGPNNSAHKKGAQQVVR